MARNSDENKNHYPDFDGGVVEIQVNLDTLWIHVDGMPVLRVMNIEALDLSARPIGTDASLHWNRYGESRAEFQQRISRQREAPLDPRRSIDPRGKMVHWPT